MLFLCLGVFATDIQAQRNCGAMDHLEQLKEDFPELEEQMREIEKMTQQFINNPEKEVNGIITIPVVVHVVYNNATENISTSQINSQLTVLTDDFRRMNSDANGSWPQASDTEIEFCLASIDPQGNSTSGITRTSTSVTSFSTNDNMKFNSSGGKDAWPTQDYLNIWVCDLENGLLGYAQFPGGPANTDGVVVDYQYFGTTGTATAPFDLGRTCTHEVGHWLNLYHIWGDGPCSADDLVGDTPNSDNPNYGCPLNHNSCGTLDMVANYMDYTDDSCMNLYTTGQKTRMRALFEPNGFRASLLSSGGCGSGTPPTCSDGIQNGDETGVDCGGNTCPPCAGCSGTEVVLTIVLDNYPEETTWDIKDANNVTLASGGPYNNNPAGSTVTETICLADACYDFTIYDSYGDGICCAYGNGSYTLVNSSNGTTLASGGTFGSSETTNFCLGGGTPPTCSDGIQNGDETGIDCGGSSCPACPTCNDGIQNGDETGVDCGGSSCPACPTCNDGIQNGNETGVDCGGSSCPPCNSCSGTEVILTIVLDDYPEETTWDIVDSNNNVLASGGPYNNNPAGSTVTETICLGDACYDFTIYDSYGDGICCAYGNGSYTLVNSSNGTNLASGGSFGFSESTNFCLGGGSGGGCTDQLIDFNDFDSGWGIWIDGGSDCRRSANDVNFAYSSPRPVRLRDNTNSSTMTTQNLNLSGFEDVTIDFTYITASMESGKDFWLQISENGGSWITLEDYVSGVDFNNNIREFESFTVFGPFTGNTRFRLRCDAGNNGDRVYIDDVEISGCFDSSTRQVNRDLVNRDEQVEEDSKIEGRQFSDVKLYPNPASLETNIVFMSKEERAFQLRLINGMGQILKTLNQTSGKGENKIVLNTQEYLNGLYFIEIRSGDERYMERLLIIN